MLDAILLTVFVIITIIGLVVVLAVTMNTPNGESMNIKDLQELEATHSQEETIAYLVMVSQKLKSENELLRNTPCVCREIMLGQDLGAQCVIHGNPNAKGFPLRDIARSDNTRIPGLDSEEYHHVTGQDI